MILDGDTVANVVRVDPDAIPPEYADAPEAPEGVGVGMVWDGSAYVHPAPTETQVRAEAARRLALIAAPYAPEERETWPVQIAEAEAVAADAGADAPMLAALAAARGLTVPQMAALVLTKRDEFRAATATILAAQASLLAAEPIPHDYTADARWT
jgi:hypothetical protein